MDARNERKHQVRPICRRAGAIIHRLEPSASKSQGQETAEYALLVAVVTMVVIAVMLVLGNEVRELYTWAAGALQVAYSEAQNAAQAHSQIGSTVLKPGASRDDRPSNEPEADGLPGRPGVRASDGEASRSRAPGSPGAIAGAAESPELTLYLPLVFGPQPLEEN